MRNPASMGPAASPMSQMVPNTPMAAPRRRAEARSALSALVTGVETANTRPTKGALRKRHEKSSIPAPHAPVEPGGDANRRREQHIGQTLPKLRSPRGGRG